MLFLCYLFKSPYIFSSFAFSGPSHCLYCHTEGIGCANSSGVTSSWIKSPFEAHRVSDHFSTRYINPKGTVYWHLLHFMIGCSFFSFLLSLFSDWCFFFSFGCRCRSKFFMMQYSLQPPID